MKMEGIVLVELAYKEQSPVSRWLTFDIGHE